MTLRIVFWSAAGLAVYTYFGYPLLLFVVTGCIQAVRDVRFLFRRTSRRRGDVIEEELPSVSLIIPAYNEEAAIEAKIENSLALDYPEDKLEIIVASDGSDDRTNEITESLSGRGVTLAAYDERRGKPSVINDTVERATGDVIILSDATTMIDADAVRKIVRHFKDANVGAVNGELRFASPGEGYRGEGLYWRYEVMIKFMENRLGVVLGSSGALCAVRKAFYRPIPADCICDDFVITLNAMIDRHRAVYDPEAQSAEETAASVEMESSRRERIGAGNFQALHHTAKLLNPFRGWPALCYLSHKIFKWITWVFLLAALAANIPLVCEPVYLWTLILQGVFYGLAALGGAPVRIPILSKLARIPHYFVAMHLALFRGLLRYLRGTQNVAWQREHR